MSDLKSGVNDLGSRVDDLERTDVLPQLGLRSEHDESENPRSAQPSGLIASALAEHATKPFGSAAHTHNNSGRISTMPAKLSTTDLAVGGIRGKIADLENRLVEAQDTHLNLRHQYEQLMQRHRMADERASKAETSYVQQAAELHRIEQQAEEAQQRLHEERVRQQAQLAEVERQVIEARTRGDKRAASLDQMLNEQAERVALSERSVAEAKIDLEKARGELSVAQTAIRGLQDRLAEQTQAAAEMTRLYSQQTSAVESNTELMADTEKKLLDLRAEKANSDKQLSALESELHKAKQIASDLQTDIAVKLRHIASLESGLQIRDTTIDALKKQLGSEEQTTAELIATKTALTQRTQELERVATEARDAAMHAAEEITRLTTALGTNDVRINELSTALRNAERNLKERDATIDDAMNRDASIRSEHTQVVERVNELRMQLDDKEKQLSDVQAQLQSKTTELNATRESSLASQSRESASVSDLRRLEGELQKAQQAMEEVMGERNQLENENQAGRAELARIQVRFEEAAQTVVAARDTIAAGEQKSSALEDKLRTATLRLEEANSRLDRAAAAAEELNAQLRQRDNRIAMLEEKCAENANALSAISQDIERVSSANPNERLAAMGYVLETLDASGTMHRINRATTTVGRAATNDVAVDSNSVSRYHARIVVQPEGVWLIDLQSTNGCGVNGRRISRQILCDGDLVMIGHIKFRFSALGVTKGENSTNDAYPLIEESHFISGHENRGSQQHH